MTQKEIQEMYNRDYNSRLKTELFPDDKLPANYNLYKHAAFNFMSATGMLMMYGMSWKEYKELLTKENGYNLFETGVINKTIGDRSPDQLDRLLEENYYAVQDIIFEMNSVHIDLCKHHQDAAVKKI